MKLDFLEPVAAERFSTRYLQWDSDYFGVPTYKIEGYASSRAGAFAVADHRAAIEAWVGEIEAEHDRYYLFSEVDADAIHPIQALCLAGWRMVETRLTYYHDAIQRYDYPHRFKVRPANADDIAGLRRTAGMTRNDFDRFHADAFFSEEAADGYLATYVENSVKGFAHVVLVPDAEDPGAFLTANLVDDRLARMILSAVEPRKQGWYVKLISEMSYLLKDRGIEACFMTTQATNRAVIRTWERLGYRYGRASHVFVLNRR